MVPRNRPTLAQRRRLAKMIPEFMADLGFVPDGEAWRDVTRYRATSKFGCDIVATPILHTTREDAALAPWLACRFEREPTYSPWVMDDPRNRLYQDIKDALGDVNVYSGKYNTHIFYRADAEDMLVHFRLHLAPVLVDPVAQPAIMAVHDRQPATSAPSTCPHWSGNAD